MAPIAVLRKTGLRPLNTARPVNTAHPKTTVYSARPMSRFSKSEQSTIKRPYQIKTSLTNKKFSQKVNTAKGRFYTARPKAVNTARPNSAVVNVVRANQGHPQKEYQGYVNSGCSRHMTGNMSYISDFKELDGGYVTFGGGAKGGRITGKGTFKTSKLDFEDVLLKVPRKNNIYSVDMKNIVPKESLTCLVTKATLDESMLWHMRLATKNETSGILKSFITEIENLVDKKVKIIRCDNGTEFKNRVMSKFDGKSDEGFFIGYSLNSKAFRVYNIRTRKVEENLHIRFLEDKPIIVGDGPKWLFDIDVLTKSMNYVPVVVGANSNDFVDGSLFDSSSKNASNDEPQPSSDAGKKDDEGISKENGADNQEKPEDSAQDVNTVRPSINTASTNFNTDSLNINTVSLTVTTVSLKTTHDDFFNYEIELDMSNITTTYPVPSTPNTRIHKEHSLDHVIGDMQSVEPKKVIQALTDPSWIESMQDELLQFKLQQVWTLVDLPYGKRAIGTKWIYRNKKDERGIVIRIKARLVAQGYTQEEGIDYDEVFALVARIEAIRLFLAYASFKYFVVYQMDVKSAFMYGKIEEEVYVYQPLGFEDPEFPDKVYKVEKTLYGLHQAPRAWKMMCTEFEKMMHKKFQISSMGDLTFFLGFTPMETTKPLLKDIEAEDVDVHLYRSIIGSLMYLTASRPYIMFVYPKDSPFDLEAYTDSDYASASLDRKSTIGVKNLVFHSKTKHIEIRHHFIRDSNEKKLIQMIKIHTNQNVADVLTKAFDVGRFQYLIASIGMLNLRSIY
ncbi:putative ribonuclease H-like domain-containing protein [Tanacetum coccineum]